MVFGFNLFKRKTLFFPGCFTEHNEKEIVSNYMSILNILKIEHIILDSSTCCGLPLIESGEEIAFKDHKDYVTSLLKQNSVKKIICSCPGCAYFFSSNYKINATHVVKEIYAEAVKTLIPMAKEIPITYHDPCMMSRFLSLTEEPRLVLGLFGYDVIELPKNKNESFCCGAGGLFSENHPITAEKIAKDILAKIKTKEIVTSCPKCYHHLKKCAPADIKVYELSEVILKELTRPKTDGNN